MHFPASPYRAARIETFPGVPVDLFKDCGLDDPSITLDWYDDKPAATLLKYILPRPGRQQPRQQRPVWFPQVPGVAADTTGELKQSIVNYIKRIGTGGICNVFHATMIASFQQSCNIRKYSTQVITTQVIQDSLLHTIQVGSTAHKDSRPDALCPHVVAAYGRWRAAVGARREQTPVGPICRILLNLDGKNPNLPTVANAAPVQLQGVRLFE